MLLSSAADHGVPRRSTRDVKGLLVYSAMNQADDALSVSSKSMTAMAGLTAFEETTVAGR